MTGPILQVRHSPGMKQREAARDARETGCESKSNVRELSCSLPLQRELHALCQSGASGEMRFLRRLLLKFDTLWNSRKGHAVNVLLRFDFRDSRSSGNFHAAVVIPR